jgi:hypothetical protein
MKTPILLLVILAIPLVAAAQGIIPLAASDLPEAVIMKAETYDSETFMGYMEGGGDLFLEFGLQQLLYQEIAWANEKIRVEVYAMESAEAAFGVYSLSVVRCIYRDTASPFDCISKYQYQAAHGNLYISVTSESGSLAALNMLIPVADAIRQKNPRQAFVLPDPFNEPRLREPRSTLAFMAGPVALQNSLYPWQDLFLGVRFGMYAMVIHDPEADISFARITFQQVPDMMRFLGYAGLLNQNIPVPNCTTSEGMYHEYRQIDPLTIYFLERQRPYPIDAVLNGKP